MQLFAVNPVIKSILVYSKLSNLVEIPIHDCHNGKMENYPRLES